MNMKKILLLSSVVALLSGCAGSGNGELIGDTDRLVWNPQILMEWCLFLKEVL